MYIIQGIVLADNKTHGLRRGQAVYVTEILKSNTVSRNVEKALEFPLLQQAVHEMNTFKSNHLTFCILDGNTLEHVVTPGTKIKLGN